METTHRFIDKYPIDAESKHLIVGTIHAPKTEKIDFFYGSSISIWKLFHDAFPEIDLDPTNLDSILSFLKRNKISVTDTIVKCNRINPELASDENLEKIVYNIALKDQLLKSKIENLYFTSGFSKNSAFKNFYIDILKNGWMEGRFRESKKFDITIDNRPFTCHILYSPSGAANQSIGRLTEYKSTKQQYLSSAFPPTYAFRVARYKEIFHFLI